MHVRIRPGWLDRAGPDPSGRHQCGDEERGQQVTRHPIERTPSFNTRQFRNALGRFASGVTVITVWHQEQARGMTANAFVSVSLDPPLVLVSLDNRSAMHGILPAVGRYGVNVLAEDQEAWSNHFAGRGVPGLQVRFLMHDGIPLLEGCVAHFIVRVTDIHAAGDHTLYIGRVEHFDARDDKPLLFYGGRYQQLRGMEKRREDEFSLFSIGGMDPPVP